MIPESLSLKGSRLCRQSFIPKSSRVILLVIDRCEWKHAIRRDPESDRASRRFLLPETRETPENLALSLTRANSRYVLPERERERKQRERDNADFSINFFHYALWDFTSHGEPPKLIGLFESIQL